MNPIISLINLSYPPCDTVITHYVFAADYYTCFCQKCSLNIPAGLGLYWIVNNVITTLTSVFIRGQIAGGSELGAKEAATAAAAAAYLPLSFDLMIRLL